VWMCWLCIKEESDPENCFKMSHRQPTYVLARFIL